MAAMDKSTDPAPDTEANAERDAMDRLVERWETGAANLDRAIADGSSRHPSEVDTLMRCASELRQAMRPAAWSWSSRCGPMSSRDAEGELREVNALIARDPGMSLRARYDDDRPILIVPSHNYEITLQIGDQPPVFVDALDLLRVVSHVALDLVYGPSPTEHDDPEDGSAD